METLLDNLGWIIICGGLAAAFIAGGIQRVRERKCPQKKPSNEEEFIGMLGKVVGNSVYRGMPTDIMGMPPSGHFQKPDFSYDEDKKEEYSDKYEKQS